MNINNHKIFIVIENGHINKESILLVNQFSQSENEYIEKLLMIHSRGYFLNNYISDIMRNCKGPRFYQNGEILLLITDIFGIVSVYYYSDKKRLIIFTQFSDLISNFPNLKYTVDHVGGWESLIYDMPLGSRTLFKEIRQFQAGAVIKINKINQEINEIKYDNMNFEKISNITEKEAGIEIKNKLRKIIYNLPDKKVLLPLSAGVDSRLLASIISDVYGPGRIMAITYASHPKSLEFRIARRVCEILGIEDHRYYLIEPETYIRSMNDFPSKVGGALSIAHGHLYNFLIDSGLDFSNIVLVSGFFSDAISGFATISPQLKEEFIQDSTYYDKAAFWEGKLKFGYFTEIENDLCNIFSDWQNGSTVDTFSEYVYITTRQLKTIFNICSLYRHFVQLELPYTDSELASFLLGLPYELRKFKLVLRSAIKYLNKDLERVPFVSSINSEYSFKDKLIAFKTKLINNIDLYLTVAFQDKYLFFSPYQTECLDYNLRTNHRQLVLNSTQYLKEIEFFTEDQHKLISRKPVKQYGGSDLVRFQYWAITISETLKKLTNLN